MRRKIWPVIAVAVLMVGALVIGTGFLGEDGNDTPIPSGELEKASAAALAFTGEGEVTDHEKFDEESLYEVEVLLPNGDRVDVQLDENFNVVGHEVDSPGDEDD